MTRILLVDDEAPVRNLLRKLVTSDDVEIIEADTAESALALMETTPAAVAFCDIQMPGNGGLWLAAELRRRYPATAIILATSVTTVPASHSMRSGVIAYILKPFSERRVVGAMRAAIQWHNETAQSGPKVEDSIDAIGAWLKSLGD